MSDDPMFEREARRWLELGPTRAPDRAVQGALLAITHTPQQRDWHVPRRTSPMLGPLRIVALAATILALILGPLSLLPKNPSYGGPNGSPSQSPAPPTAAPLPPNTCPPGTPLPSGTIVTIAGPAQITRPGALAISETGELFVSDLGRVIKRLGTDGVITTYAGGSAGPLFSNATGLGLDAGGNLYVADVDASKISKIDSNGNVTVYAGTGASGTTGNEGPASQAQIQPWGVAVGPAGDLYFDDASNFRRVDPAGIIHAFAGSTTAGFSGDGGPATDATLGDLVIGVAAGPHGDVYLGDKSNHRIRRVDPSGTITTFAGTGVTGYSGDHGLATAAAIDQPFSIAADRDGSVYFTEMNLPVVRKIDPFGIITTMAGGSVAGTSGDCGPASGAKLTSPFAVAVHDGAVFISDAGSSQVRLILP